MEDALFIGLKIMCVAAFIAAAVMLVNRLRGRDELDGLINSKRKRKDKK